MNGITSDEEKKEKKKKKDKIDPFDTEAMIEQLDKMKDLNMDL